MKARRTGREEPRAASEHPLIAPLALDDVSRGMIVRQLHVAPADVVFVKGIVEASDGVAALFAVSGGELSIAAPLDRERDLTELLADIEREVATLPARVAGVIAEGRGHGSPRG